MTAALPDLDALTELDFTPNCSIRWYCNGKVQPECGKPATWGLDVHGVDSCWQAHLACEACFERLMEHPPWTCSVCHQKTIPHSRNTRRL